MIRFYHSQLDRTESMDLTIASEAVRFDHNIWNTAKEYFRCHINADNATIQVLPVENEGHEIIGYAWQDGEADRELRMLRELAEYGGVLTFADVYPDIQEVVVCGCNELAFAFVSYLRRQRIPVNVTGKYWDLLGINPCGDVDLGGKKKLVVYAEGTVPQDGDIYQTVIRSASPEFECVDRIYETNVLAGRISDAAGDFAWLLETIRGKRLVLLGTDAYAQDACDLLYSHDLDIYCFAAENQKAVEEKRTLLGKPMLGLRDLIGEDAVFLDCREKGSALGTARVDFYASFGYERNKRFFLLRDYTDIPHSNLLHVLRGKRVLLTGDERLCEILAEYLREAEQGEIDVSYTELSDDMPGEEGILCIVNPWYGQRMSMMNLKVWGIENRLKACGNLSRSDYFSSAKAFIEADLYRNRGACKYSTISLRPGGILLGRIPPVSGNIFFRGLLDGHPDILKWDYSPINSNLLFYCIRLAGLPSEKVLPGFKELMDEEYRLGAGKYAEPFCWEEFERYASSLLLQKERFTSQELFVLFHLAYTQMQCGKEITDLSCKVIYWEPHHFPRNEEFSYLAKWLESEDVNGQTICMHRNHMVRFGSAYKLYKDGPSPGDSVYFLVDKHAEWEDAACPFWEEFDLRFEDIKLHPKKVLLWICERMKLMWSDTMLRTTQGGEAWDYQGVLDFDLKPVFNTYEEFLSEFDRFRISLLSSPYQRKYGYTYENCMNFSRKELQEMLLKSFRFQEDLSFADEKERRTYFYRAYEFLRQQMWEARKHAVRDDIVPLFGAVEVGDSKPAERENSGGQTSGRGKDADALGHLVRWVREQKRLVLYGLGRDCEALLACLEEPEAEALAFCDQKAAYAEVVFHGKRVLAPGELCRAYKDYTVLITSSWYYQDIQEQLEVLGVSPERIVCNTSQLWEEMK